ncbi:MAG: hypothetical protein NTW10_05400 [Bacteroidetes bacterium]|nr:hypothetical protein [Bacteroidota bacterium]
MTEAYILLRLKQFSRSMKELGLGRLLFMAGLTACVLFALFFYTAAIPGSFYAAGIYMTIILFIQTKRSDRQFLKIHIPNFRLLLLTEYLLLSFPLLACLLFHKQWITLGTVIALLPLIGSLDRSSRQRNLNTIFQRRIPSSCFEWKGGIRKTLLLWMVLWVAGIGTSFFIGSIPLVIFVLGMIPMNFYEKGEPAGMILVYESGPGRFLWKKIKMHTLIFTVILAPLVAAFLIFHPDKWYIPVIEFSILLTIHIYIILAKYAFYKPNSKSNGIQVFQALGALGIFLPFFLPVVWILSIRFYFKSVKNLSPYLNDYR